VASASQGDRCQTFRHRVVVSASLGDRCPTFRQSGGLISKGREDQEEWPHGPFDHL